MREGGEPRDERRFADWQGERTGPGAVCPFQTRFRRARLIAFFPSGTTTAETIKNTEWLPACAAQKKTFLRVLLFVCRCVTLSLCCEESERKEERAVTSVGTRSASFCEGRIRGHRGLLLRCCSVLLLLTRPSVLSRTVYTREAWIMTECPCNEITLSVYRLWDLTRIRDDFGGICGRV